MAVPSSSIPSAVRIGHVHLKVADLERAIGFYHGVLGFDIIVRYGPSALFVSAGGYGLGVRLAASATSLGLLAAYLLNGVKARAASSASGSPAPRSLEGS